MRSPRDLATDLYEGLTFNEEADAQNPEVQTRGGDGVYTPGEIDTVRPPEDLVDDWELFQNTPIVNAPLTQGAADVVEPGARVTADSEETEEWFNDEFLPNAGVVGGQRHRPFAAVLFQSALMYLAAGNVLVENVKRDPGSDEITGFMAIKPQSVKAVTEENKPLLLAPDADVSGKDVPTTNRDEAPAFLQYHNDSLLGQRGAYDDRDVVALSQNDVVKISRNPAPGEIWGRPVQRSCRGRITALKQKLRDNEKAIQTKAYGIWSVAFGTEVVEVDNPNVDDILVDWTADEQRQFLNNKIGSDLGPGDIIGHDGAIEFDRFEGEVASGLLDFIRTDVKLIVAALPTPLYAVGWESDVNQFVVERQEKRYEKQIRSIRKELERGFTPTLKTIAEQRGLDSSGLQLRVEPEEDESPIHSLDDDAITRLKEFASALNSIYGNGGAAAHLDEELLAELVLQLPEEAVADLDVDPLETAPVDEAGMLGNTGDGDQEEQADEDDTPPADGGEDDDTTE